MWVLFEWVSGNILRTLEASGEENGDKIILSADGMDSAVLNVPLDSLPSSVRNSWQTSFVGIKHGLAYYEVASDGPVVSYAGQLKQRSIVDGKLRLQATSMMDYLEHYIYMPASAVRVTDPDQLYEFNNVTARGYASGLLSVVNADPLAPTIAIGNGSGPSNTFTTSRRVRDLPTVGEMLRELMEDPGGSEIRFHAHLNASATQLTWSVRFPDTGRLYPGRWGNLGYDLSDPSVSLVDLSPSSSYEDYFNELWHEVPVEPPEDAEDWDPVIDLRRSSAVPAGFPRYSTNISLGDVSEAERNSQVNARIGDSSKALENWEIRVWSEEVIGGSLVHPVAWTDSPSGALGRRVIISGGAEYEAEGLNGAYRCIGVEFSSNSSNVRIQLSDERSSYKRMPRTIIEKVDETIRDRFPYTTINDWKRPGGIPGNGGGGNVKPDLPTIPENPGFDPPGDGWDWGSGGFDPDDFPSFGKNWEITEEKDLMSSLITGNSHFICQNEGNIVFSYNFTLGTPSFFLSYNPSHSDRTPRIPDTGVQVKIDVATAYLKDGTLNEQQVITTVDFSDASAINACLDGTDWELPPTDQGDYFVERLYITWDRPFAILGFLYMPITMSIRWNKKSGDSWSSQDYTTLGKTVFLRARTPSFGQVGNFEPMIGKVVGSNNRGSNGTGRDFLRTGAWVVSLDGSQATPSVVSYRSSSVLLPSTALSKWNFLPTVDSFDNLVWPNEFPGGACVARGGKGLALYDANWQNMRRVLTNNSPTLKGGEVWTSTPLPESNNFINTMCAFQGVPIYSVFSTEGSSLKLSIYSVGTTFLYFTEIGKVDYNTPGTTALSLSGGFISLSYQDWIYFIRSREDPYQSSEKIVGKAVRLKEIEPEIPEP